MRWGLVALLGVVAACQRGGDSESAKDTLETAAEARAAPPVTAPLGDSGAVLTEPAARAVTAAETVATGVVRMVGADPFAQVVLESPEGHVALMGALRDEFGALAGATVRVVGAPEPAQPEPPERAIAVRSYEIVSIAGSKPLVGTLLVRGELVWLEADRVYRLDGVPDRVKQLSGARLWVVGHVADSVIHVASYGIIRRR